MSDNTASVVADAPVIMGAGAREEHSTAVKGEEAISDAFKAQVTGEGRAAAAAVDVAAGDLFTFVLSAGAKGRQTGKGANKTITRSYSSIISASAPGGASGTVIGTSRVSYRIMGTQGRVGAVTGPMATEHFSAGGRLSDVHADVIRAGCAKYAWCLPIAGARFDFTGKCAAWASSWL